MKKNNEKMLSEIKQVSVWLRFPSLTEVIMLIKVEFLTQSAGITGENLWLV